MEDDDKATILALSEHRKAASHATSSAVSVNAHAIAPVCDSFPAELADDILIAMVTKHSYRASKPKSHNGDVRSVMSQPVKPAIKSAKVQIKDEEMVINGRMYVIKSHGIQYNVSQASHKLLTRSKVPLLIAEQTEVSRVATPGSSNNIHTEWSTLVGLTTMRSLPFQS